jgi:HSP20 family protein
VANQWNPLQDLMLLQDRMNRLFEDATERRTRAVADPGDDVETADWYPAADVYDRDEEYLIALDLPGIDRSALEINIDDDRLVIKGTRAGANKEPVRSQRPMGSFLRTFNVPASVDRKQIKAEYKDGVLEVRLPKLREQKAQRIEIKVS